MVQAVKTDGLVLDLQVIRVNPRRRGDLRCPTVFATWVETAYLVAPHGEDTRLITLLAAPSVLPSRTRLGSRTPASSACAPGCRIPRCSRRALPWLSRLSRSDPRARRSWSRTS